MTTFNQSVLNKAKIDKWVIVIPVPDVLKNMNQGTLTPNPTTDSKVTMDSFIFSIARANTPTISVPAKSVSYGGQKMNLSSHTRKDLEDLTIDFTVDNRFANYMFIYNWLNIMHDFDSGIYDDKNVTPHNYELDGNTREQILRMWKYYSVEITLIPMDEYNNPILEFRYVGAFPHTLSPLKFNYQDATQIDCSATFSFSRFIARPVTDVRSAELHEVFTTTTTTPTSETTTEPTSTTTPPPRCVC